MAPLFASEWYLNLVADPVVHVRVMAEVYSASASTVTMPDRAALWTEVVSRYPMFAEYQAATEREIPLVRLVRTVKMGDSGTG